MKKRFLRSRSFILPIAFLMVFSYAKGQNTVTPTDIKEFINDIYPIVVPANFEYYNLVDSSFVLDIRDERNIFIKKDFDDFSKSNPDFRLSEFKDQLPNIAIINWKDFNLEKAKIYSFDKVPRFATHTKINTLVPYDISDVELDSLSANKKYNEIIVPVKRSWSDKRIKKEVSKKRKEYENSLKPEDKKYYRFSTPIFSYDKKFAIIQLITGGEGSVSYIFERKNNQWTPSFMFDGYVH